MKKIILTISAAISASSVHAYLSVAEVPENGLMEKFFMTLIYAILSLQTLVVLALYGVFAWSLYIATRSGQQGNTSPSREKNLAPPN
ncbi:hypothetical protein DESUT3_20560 [Desulfuromonas versatilis]|uniref:Uncharacterized protein n=1 Tax=Desulfuromonas versatilis TaxID=2802975 RepID=A0ABM8HV90_9BACT|nr:hypothetical protein [Desulfuromonas versatilis]BCR04987.1 hypothetical protein DESUT3_20560 [Desulfuromonas versatilis]